jgi:hypothetical protein
MKIKSLFLAAALLLPCLEPAAAIPPNWQPLANGYQQISPVAATALTVPAGTVEAFIICHGQAVRWRDDGTNPTSTVGVYLPADVPFPYIANLPSIKFIQTAASATCDVSYYK